jgi:hypothetical protein
VFVSSDYVEWGNTAYARQKAQVEAVLLGMGAHAIVRPSRITKETANEFAEFLAQVGEIRASGVFHWRAKSLEMPSHA